MSRPAEKTGIPGFVPCQREQCMGWVTEYRIAPTGIVPAHCKIIGLEGGM